MKKIYTFLIGLAAFSHAGSVYAQDLRIETTSQSGVEIIEGGKFDILHHMISNTGSDTKVCLGEIDFGADGEKYKAAGIDLANGWGTDGWAILHAGSDFESSVPFTEIPLNEYKSYYAYRRFGANMGFNVNGGISEGVIMGDAGALQYTKPTGKQKVYLTFFGGNGNIFAVNFYEKELAEEDFISEEDSEWGGDGGIRLRWPSEDSRYADKRVEISVYDSTPAVPVGEGTDFKDVRIDEQKNDEGIVTGNKGWGWTNDGFVVDYGTVDFGNNRFGQLVVEINHGSNKLTDYLEFYIDEVAEANKIAELWSGRECPEKIYPFAVNIDGISGKHKVFVKWVGGGTNVRDLSFYEGTPWTPATACGVTLADDLPYDDAFHYSFEGTVEGVGGPWNCEIKTGGRWDNAGNVGYTGNGTVLSFYMPDGEGIDFGNNIYETIVINHSSEPSYIGTIEESNFAFYVDLDPDFAYSEDDWKSNLDMILQGHEPIAIVRLQGTGGWGTRRHVRGDILRELSGTHELFVVYNTPESSIGANVYDIYLEPGQGQSGIDRVTTENGVDVYAEDGEIVVNAGNDTKVSVYGLNGVAVVNTAVSAGTHGFSVVPGFYVVKTVNDAGTSAAKVIVK